MRGVWLAALLVCGMVLIAAGQTSERYTLRGQVVDGATGKPLPDLQIVLRSYPGWQTAGEPVVSGPEGKFVFYGLEAGLYLADTWLDGEPIHYFEKPAGTVGATRVGPKFQDAEFTFRVTRHPSIEGTVRDEFGDPVPHANVAALRSSWADGRAFQMPVTQTTTDDRGHYRLSALAPGAWSVCAGFPNFGGNEGFRTMAPEASTVDFLSREAPRFYKRSCNPGSTASLKADWGQDLNLDVKLDSTPGIRVRGRVNQWQEHEMGLYMVPEDQTVPPPQPSIQPDGTFEFNVPEPGQYTLQADRRGPGGRTESARQTVVVENADVNGVQLTLQPVAQVSVSVQGPATPAVAPGSVSIGLRDATSRRGQYWAAQADDGSFKFAELDPGTYWVLTRTEEPFCIESLTFGGRQVMHDKLTVSPGDAGRMEVVLSTQCAEIEGKVVMPEGRGPSPYLAILMSGSPQAPGDVLGITADPDGTFSIAQLAPGRYFLWAWSQDDLSFPGPASLAEVANRATVVAVGKGQRAVAQVPLLPLPEAR